jgi:hypothetical protein
MPPTTASQSTLASQTLRRIVHGDISGPYRRNIFRILGVPTDSNPAEIRSREKTRARLAANGMAVGQANGFLLALKPAPDDKQRKEALECLMTRPLEQLIHELFWFWPSDEDGKPLSGGKLEETVQQWIARSSTLPASPQSAQASRIAAGVAAHNLAIYYHACALDGFSAVGERTHHSKPRELMVEALRYWHLALQTEAVHVCMRKRARELADPNLTDAVVTELINLLPENILQISSSLASASLADGKKSDAEAHIAQLRSSPFSSHQKEAAVRSTVTAAGEAIKRLCQGAVAQAKTDPLHSGALIRHVHAQCVAQLSILDLLLPSNDVTRVGLHDLAADTLLQCNYEFANKTEDWAESIALAELAAGVAMGVSAKESLRKRIKSLNESVLSGLNWCSVGYWLLPVQILDRLEEIREMRNQRRWQEAIPALGELILDQGNTPPPELLKVLEHCMGICLCLKSVDVYKDGVAELNKDKDVIDEIWDKLLAMNDSGRLDALSKRPNPHMQYNRPGCLRCNNTSYTNWLNFTYKELPLWMCGGCSALYDTQKSRKKDAMRRVAQDTAIFSVLAHDFDPNDAFIIKDLESTRKLAQDCGASMPDVTKAAKAANLSVAPPTLRDAWRRKQEKARKAVEDARAARAEVAKACQLATASARSAQQAAALAKRLLSLINQLAKNEHAGHLATEARLQAAETLLAIDKSITWPPSAFMDHVRLLETALEIAGDTKARAGVEAVLATLRTKARKARRMFKLKFAMAASLATAAIGLGWFIVISWNP